MSRSHLWAAVMTAAGLLGSALPAVARDARTFRADAQSAEDEQPDSIEQEVLRLTNRERAKYDLPPLRLNALLAQAARDHAENMARQNILSHELDGQGLGDRLNAVGYTGAAAENIGYNYADAAEVVRGWMNSEGHRENLLNPDYTEIGVGVAFNADGEPYYCQDFGAGR